MFTSYLNAFFINRLVPALALTTISLSALTTTAQDQPKPQSKFKVGHHVVVLQDKTTIGIGDSTLHDLKKGTTAEVIQIVDNWIGVKLQINDKLVKGWIDPARLDVCPPPAADEPEAKQQPAEPEKAAAEAKKTLADEFARMMAEKERGEAKEKPAADAPKPQDLPPEDAPVDEPPADAAAKPDVPPADAVAETAAATPSPQDQPDKPQTEPQKQQTPPPSEPSKEKEAGKQEPVKEKPAEEEKKVEEKEKEAVPPASEPKQSPPESVPEQQVPERTAPPQVPEQQPAKPAADQPESTAPGTTQPGEEQLGEGPEPLAEKFAEILARLKAQEQQAAGVTEQPEEAPVEEKTPEPPAEPVKDPAVDDPIAISVLVLRRPVDLLDINAEERIGRLVLSGDQFDNRALTRLEGLSIAALSLEGVNVSNAGIQYIQKIRGLQSLQIWSPAINDQGLKLIGELRELQFLDLEGTAVEGSGLGDLKGLNKLELLVLGPKTADAGIGQLTSLTALRQLDLRPCGELTMDCIQALAKLSNLEVIWLPSQLKARGRRALREALPECEIRS